jgi:hypothetical protein
MDTPKRRVWGERRPNDKVILQIILVFTLTCPKTFTHGCVSVKIWTCKCKSFTLIVYLHVVYVAINTYTHNIGLDLH